MVLNGHPGAVRKGIDYLTVFAAAPHLQSQRILRAFEVLLGWTPTDFDIAQAYLLGKAELGSGGSRWAIRNLSGTDTRRITNGCNGSGDVRIRH